MRSPIRSMTRTRLPMRCLISLSASDDMVGFVRPILPPRTGAAPAVAPALEYRPDTAGLPSEGFNPVGDLLAGAATALSPTSVSGSHTAEVSVPRIAIHVFAVRQDTLAAAERAGQDRRLSRATTQIRSAASPMH